jgi:hypothetical protein
MKSKKLHLPRIIISLLKGFFSLAALAFLLILIPVTAHAVEPVTVAWDQNDPVPGGYVLYWGTSSRNYTNSHNVGDATQYTVPDLQEGTTYYLAATAYDDTGNESAYSEEIVHTVNINLNTHTIAASAGAHGSITPSGSVAVHDGDNQTFIFTAEQDYEVLGVMVDGASVGTVSSYTFNSVTGDHTIKASFVYVPSQPVDSDGDGVPDDQDAIPLDPDETIDTDGDGIGNNADNDDDGDGMPDAWEIVNHLDPLVNDAAGDPDGDGITNLKEYQEGTGPYTYKDLSEPDAPVILTPFDDEVVSLTPPLTVDNFYDPDIDDLHAESQWQIFRADDNFCVLDVTSPVSLTSLKVPKLILEEDTDYTWKVRFINNHDAESDWSAVGTFTTDFANHDSDGNGIPDHQEVAVDLDLDNDGTRDRDQTDIKCVNSDAEDIQIGVSIKDSESVASIVSMEIEDAIEVGTAPESEGTPATIQFGLINFKIILNAPGDETVVAVHLSRSALDNGKLYKYDPINAEWFDYSDYAEFSPNREVVYLTLKDGGFGDADGIENGIIVDPLTVGTDSPVVDSSGSSESVIDEFMDRMLANVSCFISTAADQPDGKSNIWSEIRGRELAILFIVILFAYIGKIVFDRKQFYHGKTPWLNTPEAHK